ncbi:hypothetical protein GIB67_038202 [Kingdonia uniflora]|uniref:phosphatidate phosphatase n=1 Tax=Kingdonia uniflora TaxID=39325 RepID=A0A7J7NH09_9MAGN|nr:hypothetical protein GIB67_038202 [Kingdonia uniflora]
MNVVGRVGSLISQGVYSVATPFHPFGGAVDVIAVEQQDGTYRSTPWYVRFGKFQGVLKGTEKMVRISVNGVDANFHMYLDNSGEAYFIREVGPDSLERKRVDNGDSSSNVDDRNASINLCRKESSADNTNEVQFSDERVSLIENAEVDVEGQLFEYGEEQTSQVDSVGSTDYGPYRYDSLDHVEDVVESQGSDSEVVLISVDGHVLTAPISSLEDDTDNLQLSTPQFHLGPGDGADFRADEEFSSDSSTWAADYFGDIDESAPNYTKEGATSICNDSNTEGRLSGSHKVDGEKVIQAGTTVNVESDAVNMSRQYIFKSCLEFNDLDLHVKDDDELQDTGSDVVDSQRNCLSIIPTMEENEAEKSTGSALDISESLCDNMVPGLNIEVKTSDNNSMTIDNSDCLDSDGLSVHSVSNDPERKDEQDSLVPEAQGIPSSPVISSPQQECSKSKMVEFDAGSLDVCVKPNTGTGFDISLCGHLLRAGMGLGPADEAFEAHRISEDEFKTSTSLITKNKNLIVRVKGNYFPWEKAAPLVLGMVVFNLDLLAETTDAIPVEQDDASKPGEGTPGLTSTPSGRRWRLWPIPFRRVKTLQHTASNSSTDEVFVDSESGSQIALVESTPTSNAGNESPRKQLVRTNIPTTEQIASLNLKEGQNMITFSFSTRVLGTQQVDAHIYLWKWNARIVISDVDGTITKSDVLGQFMPLVGKDWTQSGVARLFSAIKDGKALPNGPVVISPDGLFPSLYREVIRRAPHEFKIACLEDIKALFPSDYNPFYAGFGNRDTDELSYRKIGIPKGKIFIINPKGEVAISQRIDVKSYTSLHTLVNDMFPPTSMVEQEDFNSWNYWRMPLPNIE